MKFGITTNLTWFGAPVVDFARTAEALGFESIWMGEHIVIPVEVTSAFLNGGEVPVNYRHMPNALIWLAAAAAVTTRLKLGTNVCLVPQRNPILLAKDVACLDHLSHGRFLFGIGSGWLREESAAMGVPYKDRWARTIEYLQAMRTIWSQEEASFEGEYVSFPPVYCYPKPYQKPHPPVIIGAGGPRFNNEVIMKRVAQYGDGWTPGYFTPAEIGAHLKELRRLCEEHGRDYDSLEISMNVPAAWLGVGEAYASLGEKDASAHDAGELVAQYEEAGVKRILVGMVDPTPENFVEILERASKGLGLS